MKTITFFIRDISSPGGTERVLIDIINELIKKGYNINIITMFLSHDQFYRISENVKITLLYTQESTLKSVLIKSILKLRKCIKSQCPDVFITVDNAFNIITIPALMGLDIFKISWEHFNFNIPNNVAYRFGRYLALLFSEKIVVLTKQDKKSWDRNFLARDKINQIYNPCIFPKSNHRPDFNLKRVIAVGRLEKQKGFDLLIDAWKMVDNQYPDWRLSIVGSGSERSALQEKIDRLSLTAKIEILEKTNKIAEIYQQASFLCLSSRYEGWGLVLVEAQHFNLPIVSFDCEFGPSEIIEDQIDGILIDNGNIIEFANAINQVISNPYLYNKMIDNLISKNHSELLKSHIIACWIKLIEQI